VYRFLFFFLNGCLSLTPPSLIFIFNFFLSLHSLVVTFFTLIVIMLYFFLNFLFVSMFEFVCCIFTVIMFGNFNVFNLFDLCRDS
jgi:hypothetical protein